MTEIKLTKRYPLSRVEDITDAYMRGWNDALDAVQNGKFHIAEQTEPKINMAEDIVESFGFKAESYRQAKAKTEPTAQEYERWLFKEAEQTEPSICEHCKFFDGEDCYFQGECKVKQTEPQTDCDGCIYLHCNGECGEVEDEPSTDCSWKKGE